MAFYHDLKDYDDDPDDPLKQGFPHYPGKQKWIAERLLALREDLRAQITDRRRPDTLIIGSWNIRAFDGGMPRLDESYHYIAEIIDKFDICALQEVKKDLAPLKRLVKLLGPNWDYFVTDISAGDPGNSERMAFVYNTNKVLFRNLIGEIVLPAEKLIDGKQIARSPFFASFQAGWFRFTLCSAHILFGGESKAEKAIRAKEISAIAEELVKRAKQEDQVYVFLGDMNIESPDGDIMKALTDSGMVVPDFPPTNLKGDRHYDQIAFTVKGDDDTKTELIAKNAFDWRGAVFGPWPHKTPPPPLSGDLRITDAAQFAHYTPINLAQRAHFKKAPYKDWAGEYRDWTSHEMSDHLPIWVEIKTDYSDGYLAQFL